MYIHGKQASHRDIFPSIKLYCRTTMSLHDKLFMCHNLWMPFIRNFKKAFIRSNEFLRDASACDLTWLGSLTARQHHTGRRLCSTIDMRQHARRVRRNTDRDSSRGNDGKVSRASGKGEIVNHPPRHTLTTAPSLCSVGAI